jgi:uncharacterized protein
MTFKEKKELLNRVYEKFERDVREYKQQAICKKGCTFCCTDAGRIDITTLEGLIIQERVNRLPKQTRNRLKKKIAKNKRDKEKEKRASCPFLKKDKACLVYDVRPFACRQLYSIQTCEGSGPTIHRQAVDLAEKSVAEMQRLDDTGYSGHISYILILLDKPEFRKLYLAGGFDPAAIMDYGKRHGIRINRLIV